MADDKEKKSIGQQPGIPSSKGEGFSWKARGRSFVYAFRGIRKLISEEHNARIHTAAAILAIAAGIWLRISATEWAIVAICIGSVLAAEAINSAVEALANKVNPEYDPLIGKAKDFASAAVLLTAIAAAIAGLIIFLPPIIVRLT
ncbi:MAG: diacylglycerol kinase family protein [Muribaculaceae bacterium]|nr:diacylglycerol kinase family protein [Muribaculaceae bacterium]